MLFSVGNPKDESKHFKYCLEVAQNAKILNRRFLSHVECRKLRCWSKGGNIVEISSKLINSDHFKEVANIIIGELGAPVDILSRRSTNTIGFLALTAENRVVGCAIIEEVKL